MASLPASADDIRNLFDYIDTGEACDNTLRRTTEFIQMKGLDLDRILRWLKENGGYCDCEVVFNVEDAWTRHAGPEYQRD